MRTLLRIAILALLFVSPATAFATTAVVIVDTGEKSINALEGTLILPEEIRISGIETGNSVVTLWVEEPRQADGTVKFAGITPGGFAGAYPVFTLRGTFTRDDLERVRFESVAALANDGTGMRVPVTLSLALAAFEADTEPPENFTPAIASDPNVSDGEHFLVFATQDKGSGVKRYEVREGRFGRWREVESPYILAHQKLDKDIYLKAIDYEGNERIVVVSAVHSSRWGAWGLFAILIVVVVAAITYKKQWLRFTR